MLSKKKKTFWGNKRKEFADAQQQNADWLRQAAQPARAELQAEFKEFKEDITRSMLELVRDLIKQELPEQAAAPPAAAAAQEDGAAGSTAGYAGAQGATSTAAADGSGAQGIIRERAAAVLRGLRRREGSRV